MSKKEPIINNRYEDILLPQSIIDEFARLLVPEIRKFYESEEGQREFVRWRVEQKIEQQDS